MLSRLSDLQVMSGPRVLDVTMSGRPGGSVLLGTGRAASLWFRWQNWCGAEQAEAYRLRLVLPNGDGYLEAPVIDSLGRPSVDAPSCEARAYPSAVSVWW